MFRDTALHRVAKRLLPEALYPRNILARQIRRRTEGQVFSGPFRGMRYTGSSVGSVYYPKLLGTYERELHPIVEAIVALQPDVIVNVGAAEGYYAVGLARRLPAARISAYEASAEGRAQLASLCQLNNVAPRVEIHGWCDKQELGHSLAGAASPVVICDVEGFEAELLDLEAVPALRQATLLVELHEFAVPGVADQLTARFGASHGVERIWQTDRSRGDYPFNNWFTHVLPAGYATYQVQEFRPEKMSWLWMTPRIA